MKPFFFIGPLLEEGVYLPDFRAGWQEHKGEEHGNGTYSEQTQGDGLSIQAAIWNGEGKAILCIHGLTANCRCWDLLASGLAPRHRVVALDLRGRGHSEAPPSGYSLAHHVRDILALLDDLL